MNAKLERSCNPDMHGLSAHDINLPYYEQFLSRTELSLMRYDREGLRMCIPFELGQIVAQRIPGSHVMDLCCGVGSLAISLAMKGKQVVAIDTNSERLLIAQENARCFNVEHLIDFQLQDCRDVILRRETTPLFFDPPWGGSARRVSEFTLSNFEFDIRELLTTLIQSNRYIAMKLPFNFLFSDLIGLSSKWTFTPICHERLQFENGANTRPLFWLAEHDV
jgi:SAM-dependent methyltransferase